MQQEWEAFPGPGHKIGLGLIASAGLVSALSTFALLSYIGWTVRRSGDTLQPFSRGLRAFTSSYLGWFLISLLFCDFLQGLAFALNFHWVAMGKMKDGKVCIIQGAVSQVGDLGAAIWSTAIAFHTFWLLFLVRQPHRLVELFTLISGWSVIIALPVIGPAVIESTTRGSFYGLSGAWCWIGTRYGPERVIYLYGWVFAALSSSLIIYTLIYLRFTGLISLDDGGKMRFHFRRRSYTSSHSRPHRTGCFPSFGVPRTHRVGSSHLEDTGGITSETSQSAGNMPMKRVARRIMWYPLVYAVVVIPVSICRMSVLGGWAPPFSLLVFAGVCFGGSGLSNTILFLTTRQRFLAPGSSVPTGHVQITTQRVIMHDYSTKTRDEDIGLDPIKFSSPRGVVSDTDQVFYQSDTPKAFYGEEANRVMIIGINRQNGGG